MLPPTQSLSSINALLLNIAGNSLKNDNRKISRTIFLRPLSILHFDSRMENMGDHINKQVNALDPRFDRPCSYRSWPPCINFVNLSTVQAVNRSKEIGVRKVLGSGRWNLLWQILGETALVVIASILTGHWSGGIMSALY
ncbi:MAG: FtsX-like permease family protein [Puia sp.]